MLMPMPFLGSLTLADCHLAVICGPLESKQILKQQTCEGTKLGSVIMYLREITIGHKQVPRPSKIP